MILLFVIVRKCKKYENIENIKKRNSKYYYFSKLLREVVECYGQCSMGDHDYFTDEPINTLVGPYYCGMNCILNMGSFSIRLYSPVSTSMQIEVAMKFGGPNGIILQFNNTRSRNLRGFDMSWISQYKLEDERFVNICLILLFILLIIQALVWRILANSITINTNYGHGKQL